MHRHSSVQVKNVMDSFSAPSLWTSCDLQ